MKIAVAPNAFKGSLGAYQAAEAIVLGIRQVVPEAEIVSLPIADGGDGLLDVLQDKLDAEFIEVVVQGPLGRPVKARYLYSQSQRLAVIEMATAAGLALLSSEQRDPLRTSSYGVGELILHAVDVGATSIIMGVGGSATNDAGTSMASALGVRFLDDNDESLVVCGASLIRIRKIDVSGIDPRLSQINFRVICDVGNPLLGARGATYVFGPQKGASDEQLELLESGMNNFADVLEQGLNIDARELVGGGAAGGMGAGLVVFLNAELLPGADLVLDILDFDTALEGADLLITAEGQLDAQTISGKAPAVAAKRAKERSIPCIALAGSVTADIDDLRACGIVASVSLRTDSMSLEESMNNAAEYLTAASANMMTDFMADSQQGVFSADENK